MYLHPMECLRLHESHLDSPTSVRNAYDQPTVNLPVSNERTTTKMKVIAISFLIFTFQLNRNR